MPLYRLCRPLLSSLLGLAVASAAPSAAGPIATSGDCPERTVTLRSRDLSCYVTPRELARWLGEGDAVIVDTRPARDFRNLRIPGSVNLPARSLAGRGHLKSRRLLLVDRGHSSEALEAACRELRASGFASVGIVEGGLHAWAQLVGDLEGDRLMQRGLNRISARQLALEVRYDHWLVVDVSESGDPDVRRSLPRVVHVPLHADPALFRRALASAIGPAEAGPGARFVAILESDGSRHVEIERALSSLGVVHAYFVEGGLEAYREVLAAQRSRMASLDRLGDPKCVAP